MIRGDFAGLWAGERAGRLAGRSVGAFSPSIVSDFVPGSVFGSWGGAAEDVVLAAQVWDTMMH